MNNPLIDQATLDACCDPANKADTMIRSFNSEGTAYDPTVSVAQELGQTLDLGLGQPG